MVKTDIILPIKYKDEDIACAVCTVLPIDRAELKSYRLLRRSLDLSDTKAPHYRATVLIEADPEKEAGLLKMRKKVFTAPDLSFNIQPWRGNHRPVVVGAGPAGLFAAITLAEAGARPILLERGLDVKSRAEHVEKFNSFGLIDPECNVQFGEGGAGTYSDGKLKCGAIDKYKMRVLDLFISSGAGEEIAYSTNAHLGTDKLSDIVMSLREKLISLGGEVIFSAKMTGIKTKNGEICGVIYENGGTEHITETNTLLVAIGHSARDTITMLYDSGIKMSAKGFGIGVRIEHPRDRINRIVYKDSYGVIEDTASYHLVTHLPNGRSVYSFCMCPGGSVVAATGEEGSIVTNGMSEYSRMADNSNAALLVSVTADDFASDNPLAGIELQRKIERGAYGLTEGYRAPAIRLCDFLSNSSAKDFGDVKPSYPRGVEPIECERYLPSYVTESLRSAFPDFDSWMPGYIFGDAVLTGPETRTTSPVRMERGFDYQSVSIRGLYPIGEGAGYAGGIISSATDGIKGAEAVILKYSNR